MSTVEHTEKVFNTAINFAITLGIEASVFLECWREGDWETCRAFGFPE